MSSVFYHLREKITTNSEVTEKESLITKKKLDIIRRPCELKLYAIVRARKSLCINLTTQVRDS